MPTFVLNKLVRDGLRQAYADLGQEAVYRELEPAEHIALLGDKELEEFAELESALPEQQPEEAADCAQIREDYAVLGEREKSEALAQKLSAYLLAHQVDMVAVESLRAQKYAKKGGFVGGTFVTTLTLHDDDEWAAYYRNEPEKYPEIT